MFTILMTFGHAVILAEIWLNQMGEIVGLQPWSCQLCKELYLVSLDDDHYHNW